MPHRVPFRRAAHGLAGALCAALVACSGGSGGPTAPDVPPEDVPMIPVPFPDPGQPSDDPGPPQPIDNVLAGTYVLARINDSEPGQMVTLANPDGSVIGLYRFHENTTLGLTQDQDWSLAIHFEEEGATRSSPSGGSWVRATEATASVPGNNRHA